jgi:hypothetical protein
MGRRTTLFPAIFLEIVRGPSLFEGPFTRFAVNLDLRSALTPNREKVPFSSAGGKEGGDLAPQERQSSRKCSWPWSLFAR